jgi:hypothetical protein
MLMKSLDAITDRHGRWAVQIASTAPQGKLDDEATKAIAALHDGFGLDAPVWGSGDGTFSKRK